MKHNLSQTKFLSNELAHSFIISIILIVQIEGLEKLETGNKLDPQHFINLA